MDVAIWLLQWNLDITVTLGTVLSGCYILGDLLIYTCVCSDPVMYWDHLGLSLLTVIDQKSGLYRWLLTQVPLYRRDGLMIILDSVLSVRMSSWDIINWLLLFFYRGVMFFFVFPATATSTNICHYNILYRRLGLLSTCAFLDSVAKNICLIAGSA